MLGFRNLFYTRWDFPQIFIFFFSGLKYGGEDSLLKPFLHTWSLAIEEQFYIIFPIAFYLIYKYFNKYIFIFFIVLFALSFSFAVYGSIKFPSLNFYIIPSRIWELVAGALLAFFEIKYGRRNNNFILNNILTIAGLLIIIFSILFFKNDAQHPSFVTILPVIGVCLLIWFLRDNLIIFKLLSTKIFVGIGLISYSLYLWHYPIFAFARITGFVEGDLFKKIIIAVSVLLLSIFSYFLVEKPARNKNNSFKILCSILSIVFILNIFINLIVIYNKGLPNRYGEMFIKNEVFNEKLRQQTWKFLRPNIPNFNQNSKIKILFIGDSHSKDMFNVFYQNKNLFKNFEFSRIAYGFTKDSLEKNVNISTDKNFLLSDYIVISDKFLENELKYLDKFISFLKTNKKKVIILSKTNEYKSGFRDKKYRLYPLTLTDKYLLENNLDNVMQEKDFLEINKIHYENRIVDKYEIINRKIYEIAIKNDVKFLSKQEFLCDEVNKTCDGITKDGYKIFYDYGHYTMEGAKYFGGKIYNMGWFKLD